MIHPLAIVDEGARLADDVEVGPWTYIGADVEIGAGSVIGPHVVLRGPTTIGERNKIFQFSSIGEEPQDKKYDGEATRLQIGNDNVIRECCTIHRGTIQDTGITRIGNHNLLMAYVHVAHDCIIDDHVIMANNASLAGHVHLGNYVILGGFSGVHQFCRMGAYSFSAIGSVIVKDVPPYVMVSGQNAEPHGLNSEGLKRHGFDADDLKAIRQAYKIIYRQGHTTEVALTHLTQLAKTNAHIQPLIAFIKASERGIIR